MTLLFAILTKNVSFRSYAIFAYLLCAHIGNINMHMYITNAHGHELSESVRANVSNLYLHHINTLRGPGPVLCMIRERHVILKAALHISYINMLYCLVYICTVVTCFLKC